MQPSVAASPLTLFHSTFSSEQHKLKAAVFFEIGGQMCEGSAIGAVRLTSV